MDINQGHRGAEVHGWQDRARDDECQVAREVEAREDEPAGIGPHVRVSACGYRLDDRGERARSGAERKN